MAQTFLETHDLVKYFGPALVVDKVNIKINRGEIFALLGSSGCGKSTLLRMLAGLENPSSGRMELGGVDLAAVPPHMRPINMMFQSFALFPHLSVWDNIAFGLRRERLGKQDIASRVQAMLELVQLGAYAKRKPWQLSGGQQQRVALARSLAKRPSLLLLDEPLGALDKKLREQTQFELTNIIEQVGVTCVMVTHDQEEAMIMADRIAVMSNGKVLQVGTPHEIYEAPNCRFVADFIGNLNMFDGMVKDGDMLQTAMGCIRLPAGSSNNTKGAAALVVRPEKLMLATHRPNSQKIENCFSGKVKEIAYFGPHNTYIVEPPDGNRVKVTMTNVSREDRNITWEDQVFFWWDACDSVLLQG